MTNFFLVFSLFCLAVWAIAQNERRRMKEQNDTQDQNATRPVIIQSLEELLSKKERETLTRIAKDMQVHLDALDKLTAEYRELVGYTHLDISFMEEFDYYPNAEDVIGAALRVRKEMVKDAA